MNNEERARLKAKIIKRYELYALNYSRFKRLLKDPIRTFLFYIIATIARVKPFRIKAKTLWGDRMTYFLPEGQAILYYGFFEANLTNFLINFLKKGDSFVDIGAHVGYYSVLAARLVEETGRVDSFEPTPRTFESLKYNVSGKSNAIINNCAVLNEEKEISFVDYGPKFSAFNGFKNRTSDDTKFLRNDGVEINVKTIVFDKYCRDNNLHPTFVKIDAEGAEHLILLGMNYVMDELRPLISIEVAGEEEWQENCQKSIQILTDHKYIAYQCDLEGRLSKHVSREKYLYDNLIFIHQDKVAEYQALIKQ